MTPGELHNASYMRGASSLHLNREYVISATRGLSDKTKQKM